MSEIKKASIVTNNIMVECPHCTSVDYFTIDKNNNFQCRDCGKDMTFSLVVCPYCGDDYRLHGDNYDSSLKCSYGCGNIFSINKKDISVNEDCDSGYDSCDACSNAGCEYHDFYDGGNDGY